MNESMLSVSGLYAGYRDNTILRGVNAELADDCFHGIIGPNGCGKTTFFRAITGLIPARGHIAWWGRTLDRGDNRALARRVAVVGQDENAPGAVTVEEYVLLGRVPHFSPLQFRETARDRLTASRVMELAGAAGLAGHALAELSSGERQRAAIARALAQEPAALLLDEPTSHLDPGAQVAVMDLLARLHREGLAVIVVLHDLNLAADYCRELTLLAEGRVFCAGAPAEVLTRRNLETVYRTVVVTGQNPVTGRPMVIPVPEAYRGDRRPGPGNGAPAGPERIKP